MPSRDDKNLEMKLSAYMAPEPSELLKARILKQASMMRAGEDEQMTAAQTPMASELAGAGKVVRAEFRRKRFARRYMAVAACALAVGGIGLLQIENGGLTQSGYAQSTQEIAADFGFEEIYDWVEYESVESEDI